MKVVVFGSTGKVGLEVVTQALDLGHHVTAHARRPERLRLSHVNLNVVQGDVLDPASVDRAVRGQDVVICALGMPLMNKDGLRTKGTENIVRAMENAHVSRLVCLSGLGVGDSRAILPWHYRYLFLPLVLRHVYADHQTQEACVRNSPLDWIIARPTNFAKGAHTGFYKHGFSAIDDTIKMKISPGDVADFMVKQLADDTYLHQAPGLSY